MAARPTPASLWATSAYMRSPKCCCRPTPSARSARCAPFPRPASSSALPSRALALAPSSPQVYLCGNYGDPCASPHCLAIVRYLRATHPALVVGVHSNGGGQGAPFWRELGSLLTSPCYCRFAIDGLRDTNHLYRQRVMWQPLMAHVQAFVGAGGEAQWDFLVFRHNEHQVCARAGAPFRRPPPLHSPAAASSARPRRPAQVEAARALAVSLGFSRFDAKRTRRFVHKASCLPPSTPPHDTGTQDTVPPTSPISLRPGYRPTASGHPGGGHERPCGAPPRAAHRTRLAQRRGRARAAGDAGATRLLRGLPGRGVHLVQGARSSSLPCPPPAPTVPLVPAVSPQLPALLRCRSRPSPAPQAQRDREIYISAERLVFPCCFLAGELYNRSGGRQLLQLLAANQLSLEDLRVTAERSLAAVLSGPLFSHLVVASWARPSVAHGKLRTCSAVCGTEHRAFASQFASDEAEARLGRHAAGGRRSGRAWMAVRGALSKAGWKAGTAIM